MTESTTLVVVSPPIAASGRQHTVGSGIVEVLVNRRCESPLILGDLDPPHAHIATPRVVLTPPSSTKRVPNGCQAVGGRSLVA